MPEWEKHGLAQWKQIKWACQTSRFVRNKKKTLFTLMRRVKDQPHSGGKSKIPPSSKEGMNISGGGLSPHTNPFPFGVTRVNNAGCCEAVGVRGQACLFIIAAGLCVLREL